MVLFREKDHSYTNINTGERLCSVTQRIKSFEEPFDEKYWAQFKAEEYGVSQETVLRYWEYLRTVSAIKGSLIHKYLEYIFQWKSIDIEYPKIIENLPAVEYSVFHTKFQKCLVLAKNFFKDYHERFELVAPEKIVFNSKYAGQIDNLSLDKEIGKKRIIDYKTDKEIKYENRFQTFIGILSHMEQCNFNKYSLQTHMYKELLGEETADPIVVWINEDNDNYKLINVDDRSNEAKKLLEC